MGKFLNLVRDAISYCFAWLIIVIMVVCLAGGTETISVLSIAKVLLFCVVTSVMFVGVFSSCLIKRMMFILRLSLFTALFLPAEIAFLYWVGIFEGKGNVMQWGLFVGIVVILYVSCLIIDITINRRLGKDYTSQLKKYKEGLVHE